MDEIIDKKLTADTRVLFSIMQNRAIYPIRVVARRTGLSVHVIRAWERRYEAVKPQRTSTQRRLYSPRDIQRLTLLRRAVMVGNSIAQMATLDDASLRELTGFEPRTATALDVDPEAYTSGDQFQPSRFVQQAIEALQALEPAALEQVLERAAVTLSRPVLIEQVIVPLTERIGALWAEGSIKIVHEHAASAVLRHFLWNMGSSTTAPPDAPVAIAATLIGQWHEFGALLALSAAVDAGWRGIYCGPNLPPEEIAAAVEQKKARAILVGIGQPADSAQLGRDLGRLVRSKPSFCALIVGGPGVESVRALFDPAELIVVPHLHEIKTALQELLIF
jgi:MerR family transcriptional regulator, light-induced transcriptional regulator